jgi:hypothetical protein
MNVFLDSTWNAMRNDLVPQQRARYFLAGTISLHDAKDHAFLFCMLASSF